MPQEGGVESAVGNVGLKNSLHIFIRDIAENRSPDFRKKRAIEGGKGLTYIVSHVSFPFMLPADRASV